MESFSEAIFSGKILVGLLGDTLFEMDGPSSAELWPWESILKNMEGTFKKIHISLIVLQNIIRKIINYLVKIYI